MVLCFIKKIAMENLTYMERIAVMRILLDIILADGKVDCREKSLFETLFATLGLDESAKTDIDKLNSLLALTIIHEFNQDQKEEFAKLMGQMIVIDEDINYNEVKIYNVVNEFCNIKKEFNMDEYPNYSHS